VSERKRWTLWQAVLLTASVLALLFLTPIVIGALAGYLSARSGAKTVEIIRYVTTANSSVVPARSPP
jgi:hypothetical protein